MIGALLDFRDIRNGKPCTLANFLGVFFRNLAELGHRFDCQQFDFQPDLKFARVRPNLSHLWPGIAIDHSERR